MAPTRTRPAYTVPADATPDEAHRLVMLQALALLGESLCPYCGGVLTQAVGDSHGTPGTGRPWLECLECACFWQVDQEQQEVTWEAAWSWCGFKPFPYYYP